MSSHICLNNHDSEQCVECLIQWIEKQEFNLGIAPDKAYTKENVYFQQAIQSIKEIS